MLTAVYFFSIAFGASLSSRISRVFGRRHAFTLAAAFVCMAGAQVALAVQDGILGFVAVFVVFSVLLGVSETPASSILHACVEDRQRSTMLSLRSLIQQLGGALGLVMAGAFAEAFDTPTAWMIGAVYLILAATLTLLLARRLAREDV